MKTILFVVLSLMAIVANASTLYVTEFVGAPPLSVYYQAARAPAVTNQTVAIGASSVRSAAFNANTGIIRIHTDVNCHLVIGGTAPTAVSTSMRMVAGQTEYFLVTPGDKLAVINEP